MGEKIGEIDIDTLKAQYSIEMASRKIERMQKVVAGTDRQMKAWQKTLAFLGTLGGAFGAALSIVGIANYLRSLKTLGDEIEANKRKFRSGSDAAKDFNKSIDGISVEQITKLEKLGQSYDNFFLRVKVGVAGVLLKMAEMAKGTDASTGPATRDDLLRQKQDVILGKESSLLSELENLKALEKADLLLGDQPKRMLAIRSELKKLQTEYANLGKQIKEGSAPQADAHVKAYQAAQKATLDDIIAREDELAEMRGKATSSMQDQKKIGEAELQLERAKLNYAQQFAGTRRDQENSAMESIGARRRELLDLAAREAMMTTDAQNKTKVLALETSGQRSLAKLVEIRSRYEKEIFEAQRMRNKELVAELRMQQALEEKEFRRQQHKMTPRERLEERRAQRQQRREMEQTDKAEGEFESRWKRGAKPTTPGSEYYKWAQRKGFITGTDAKPASVQKNYDQLVQQMARDLGIIAKEFTQ